MLSKACTYGIHAMIYVAMNKQEGVNMPISKIADDLHIPFHFLKKILQSLGENGLLRTQRSAKGGVSLAKDASEISIYDIIKVLDGDAMFHQCILGLHGCGEQTPCAMHAGWATERTRLRILFETTTLKDASAKIKRFDLRFGLEKVEE